MGAGASTHGFGQDESPLPRRAKVGLLGEAEVWIFSGGGGKCQAPQGAASRNSEQLTSFANNFHQLSELPSLGICVFFKAGC